MEKNKEDYYSLQDLIHHSKVFLYYLLKKWWLILLIAFVGAALGIGYYSIQKPKYKAITTFILEDNSGSGNGLAGLASQFGFNISSLTGGGNIFTGDNILNIL